jgi:ornithine carbamoyltransferase/carbamoyltransferase
MMDAALGAAGDPAARARRSFLSVRQLSAADLARLVARSVEISIAPDTVPQSLADRVVATFFEKTSTRTRTAFSVAALRLGAQLVDFGADSLQLNTGESLADTARILGMMLDGVVIRSTRTLADLAGMLAAGAPPLVNAMVAEEHPTQAVSDLAVLSRHRGGIEGLSMLYVGEGNNTASALVYALARVPGASCTLYVPPGYGLAPTMLAQAAEDAEQTGARIHQIHQSADLPSKVDVVYTTRWQTTGTTKSDPSWREVFRPYFVDEAFLGNWPDAIFMHDLPAPRGDEVSGTALDGERSLVWPQAHMKLFSAMAVLETFWGNRDAEAEPVTRDDLLTAS